MSHPGACGFLPSVEKHLSIRTKESCCSIAVDDRSAIVAEGTNAHKIVAKGWHDVSLAKGSLC